MIVTSRAPRIAGPRASEPVSGALLGSSARRALPVLRIPNESPLVGKPARRVLDTAAGLELGGSAEKTARRTSAGSRAIALAIGVADGSRGYSTIWPWAVAAAKVGTSTAAASAVRAQRRRSRDMGPPG
jgi:hypothetical protein